MNAYFGAATALRHRDGAVRRRRAARAPRVARKAPLGYRAELGPYRDSHVLVEHGLRAPAAVRLAAFLCILFGQMCVPGALAAGSGVLAFAEYGGLGGLLGVPGLVVASALWVTGYKLLFRRANRREWARFAVRTSIALNVAIVAAYAVYAGAGMPSFANAHPLRTFVEPEIAAGTLAYAALSLAQAVQLHVALARDLVRFPARAPSHALPKWLVRLLQRKRERQALGI